MAVVFREGTLAELCNSRARLNARWGEALGAEIARRLIELHAADASTIHSLPYARVETGPDDTLTVEFQHGLAVRCETGSLDLADDYFVIIDIYVNEEER
jgi:hypothetical protein